MGELSELKAVENVEQQSMQVAAIVNRASVFDVNQQALLKSHIDKLKLFKKSDVNRMFTKANGERESKMVAANSSQNTLFTVGSLDCKYLDFGYAYIRHGKGDKGPTEQCISNCFIDITEERTIIEGGDLSRVKKKLLVGKFTSATMSMDFEVDTVIWSDASAFYTFFVGLCGIAFQVLRSDVDLLRQVVHATSEAGRPGMKPCQRSIYYSSPGWYGSTYLTRSVLIDQQGVRPNTEKPVDDSCKEHQGNLDFVLLSDQELSSVLFHIKKDFLSAFHRHQAMVGLGFTMMAGVHQHLGLMDRPVLWYSGTSGTGKTALAMMLQNFYGKFDRPANWSTTSVSVLNFAYQFKDAMMVMDDFKSKVEKEILACVETIQHSYDNSIRGTLKKDGEQRADRYSRCLLLMTGEEVPANHASVFARMIIME